MVCTDRHEAQSPAASEVGRGVGSQTLRAVLQPRPASALALYRTQQEPGAGAGRAQILPEGAVIGSEGGGKRPPARGRRFLCQYREHVGGGATVDIAGPYLLGRPEDGTEGARLEAMGQAQAGQPGGQQFIRLGLHMAREELS